MCGLCMHTQMQIGIFQKQTYVNNINLIWLHVDYRPKLSIHSFYQTQTEFSAQLPTFTDLLLSSNNQW